MPAQKSPLTEAVSLLKRDEPDTGAAALDAGSPTTPSGLRGASETGVCYICRGVGETELLKREVLEVFANPHASTLERMV